MERPDVIVFDVNETLSDMAPMADRFSEVGAAPELATVWFASTLRDGFALAAAGATASFSTVAVGILRTLLSGTTDVTDRDAAIVHIMRCFLDLELHPDVAAGVAALAEAGVRLVTLSNGSVDVAEGLLSRAGIRRHFEHVLSVDDAGVWKPAPEPYHYAARACATDPARMLLVAVHPWDIDGAGRAGMRTAWVDRLGTPYPDHFHPPDHTVAGLPQLAAIIGPPPTGPAGRTVA